MPLSSGKFWITRRCTSLLDTAIVSSVLSVVYALVDGYVGLLLAYFPKVHTLLTNVLDKITDADDELQ